jgi:hypothetical protein
MKTNRAGKYVYRESAMTDMARIRKRKTPTHLFSFVFIGG